MRLRRHLEPAMRSGLVVLFTLGATTSASATIAGISSDGCPGTTCLPSFVTPIVAGKPMSITVKGQFVDLSTRVEISGSGLGASLGARQGGNNSSIVVNFSSDPTVALGERTVKLRYAIETSGPDTLKVRVVRGGRVDRIEQKVPGLVAGTTRLIAADAIPVNQRVTLVFFGTRLANSKIAPILAVKDPRPLSGCVDTRCEFELEFTRSGPIDVNLYDADVPAVGNNLLYKFFHAGAHTVTVTGTSTSAGPAPTIPRIPSGRVATPATFVDVAPRANMLNVFRRTGNPITIDGRSVLPVEDRWCADNGVQTPAAASAAKLITVPDITWGVSNVGTAEVTTPFVSELRSSDRVLQTQTIPAGTLHPGATQDFTFTRARSRVRVIRFAPPAQPGCFVNPHDADFFEDPPFTVTVDANNVVPEDAVNRSNNTRAY
jgi:hypothetical protein